MPRALRRMPLFAVLLLLAALLAGPAFRPNPAAALSEVRAGEGAPRELVLFAASSLADVMADLAAAYESRRPGMKVLCHQAASSFLAAQLLMGERADLFSPADPRQLRELVESGRIDPGDVSVFAGNRLVVAVPAGNPAGVTAFADLGRRRLSLVLAAPGVPARVYAEEAVSRLVRLPGTEPGFRERFFANLVSEEANVRQVASKVVLGEADAGLVYATDITPEIAHRVLRIELPPECAVKARYAVAVLRDSPLADAAREFRAFLLGEEARIILARHGFDAPSPDPADPE